VVSRASTNLSANGENEMPLEFIFNAVIYENCIESGSDMKMDLFLLKSWATQNLIAIKTSRNTND
jgi:hypothetical protein